jgi:hypothetical protein
MTTSKPEEPEPSDLTWQGSDLVRIPPGDYQAICLAWQGPEWVRAFHCWKLRLDFSLLAEDVSISAFFNLGEDEAKARVGKRSNFFAAWSIANGALPRRGESMTYEVFTDPSLLFLVRVADASWTWSANPLTKERIKVMKPDALIYSRVLKILRVDRR